MPCYRSCSAGGRIISKKRKKESRKALFFVGRAESPAPTLSFRDSDRCHCRGERTERCQWQIQRGERVAAVKSLAAQMPQQNFGHRNRKSVLLNYRKENGLPRQCAHWLAMTEQGMRAAGHTGPALQNSTAPFNSCRRWRHTTTLHSSLLSFHCKKRALRLSFCFIPRSPPDTGPRRCRWHWRGTGSG